MAIDVTFLRDTAHGGDSSQPQKVASMLTEFVDKAQSTIHIAIYDFRLEGELGNHIIQTLIDKANNGIEVQIGYYAGKPTHHAKGSEDEDRLTMTFDHILKAGGDPAPTGTHEQLQTLFQNTKVQIKVIQGSKLMHNKYIVRDANTSEASLWTGSANFTNDAWTFQENNIVQFPSTPHLCAYYENDFQELWRTGNIHSTGVGDAGTVSVDSIAIDCGFSPGEGKTIDNAIANLITTARTRIKVCSMILTSHAILAALDQALHTDQVPTFTGIYDKTQMAAIVKKWEKSDKSAGAVQMFNNVTEELVGKTSAPYKPDSKHNFMHNKVVVCDNALVTGSFNFSRSATENSENMLIIHSESLADQYSSYIDELVKAYS